MTLKDIFHSLSIPEFIQKNDCGYCFHTPLNQSEPIVNYLNICLQCFQSFCSDHIELHRCTVLESLHEAHNTYLKFYKLKKTEAEEPSGKRLKLEVTEGCSDDNYNTFWSIFQITDSGIEECFKYNDPDIEIELLSKINKIINAHSTEFKDAITTWSLDIKSCKHVKSLEPSENLKQISSSCNDCQLNNNVWVCLYCGNVGCGRQQVGITGNSHALQHFHDNPDHCIAVKLGSLSSSTADIYCYSCDDEVKFDDQIKWISLLKQWGIDLQDKMANEKCLVELQVEQNMNWDFQMVDAQGNKLTQLSASPEFGCGLINLGNSCYINSVLQVLFNGGVNKWSLDNLGEFPHDIIYPSTDLKCQLIKIRNAFKVNPSAYLQGIKLSSFKNCVGKFHEEFASGRQQDAMEFFMYLNNILDGPIFKNEIGFSTSDLLKFVIEDRLECNVCHKVKYTSQKSELLQISLIKCDQPQSIEERLSQYFAGEIIEFKCPDCNKMTSATKKPGFKSFPNTLLINPMRIEFQNYVPVKANRELKFPGIRDNLLLDISSYKSYGLQSNETPFTDGDVFEPNKKILDELTAMGFSKNACVKSLFYSGNNNLEAATSWLFQHIDSPTLNEEFKITFNSEALKEMILMGLDPKLCEKSLIINQGNLNASVEWIFSHMNDSDEIEEYGDKSRTKIEYELRAVICHKGNSVQSGHYVSFIKKISDGFSKWVLYNDEKIILADSINLDEIEKNGYIYLFCRCD